MKFLPTGYFVYVMFEILNKYKNYHSFYKKEREFGRVHVNPSPVIHMYYFP